MKLVPRKVYLYRSISNSLTDLVKRPGFMMKCEHWRSRLDLNDKFIDVYEGRMWKELNNLYGQSYLCLPGNLCLGINVDWFNPHKDSPYSIGAIYLVVLNLLREEWYKIENVILAGIIPRPNEPKGNINSFLSPLVEDLKSLHDGIVVRSPKAYLSLTTTGQF